MKVLAFNGSPHKNGCTYTALRIIADELEKQGIETEIIHVGGSVIRGCTDCGYCGRSEEDGCVFKNDLVNECLEKSKTADGILLGSPVYYSGIAGTMKSFLDRFFFSGSTLQYKVGAAVVSTRRAGDVDTFHQLNNYFNLRNIIITPGHYWNAVHGTNPQEVLQDKEGVQLMRALGRNMAWLMQSIEQSKGTVPMPEREARVFTNFIR